MDAVIVSEIETESASFIVWLTISREAGCFPCSPALENWEIHMVDRGRMHVRKYAYENIDFSSISMNLDISCKSVRHRVCHLLWFVCMSLTFKVSIFGETRLNCRAFYTNSLSKTLSQSKLLISVTRSALMPSARWAALCPEDVNGFIGKSDKNWLRYSRPLVCAPIGRSLHNILTKILSTAALRA